MAWSARSGDTHAALWRSWRALQSFRGLAWSRTSCYDFLLTPGSCAKTSRMEHTLITLLNFAVLCVSVLISGGRAQGQDSAPWVVYDGHDGPGKGQHIVFVTGDEEYLK